MRKIASTLVVITLALAATAVSAKGGNPKNNGNYDLNNVSTTPLYVWSNGKLVKNPQFAIERSTVKERNQEAISATDDVKQYE
ncbi:hypothetical protein D3C77_406340 [compost metagenome]